MKILIVILFAGCFAPETTTCADGTTCPSTKVCAPVGGGCVDPDQVAACNGLGEGANCAVTGVVGGVCQSSVCSGTVWASTVAVGGDVGTATIGLDNPGAVAVDRLGNVFIADSKNNCVRRLDATGVITTVAGVDGISGLSNDGGFATNALLDNPSDLALDGFGDLYIADTGNNRIRRVDTNGIITTIAGSGNMGGFTGDSEPATTSQLSSPQGVAIDGLGNIYIADTGNHRVREIYVTNGLINTIAGTNNSVFDGDGDATVHSLGAPVGVAVAADGTLYVGDNSQNRIRTISNGTLKTVAGNGNAIFAGDGPATSTAVSPTHLVLVGSDIVFADTAFNRVRKLEGGAINTVAGNGTKTYTGDGNLATDAGIYAPGGVAFDHAGQLYIADSSNLRIRRVDLANVITTLVGNGRTNSFADGGGATSSFLPNPQAIAVAADGTSYISDGSIPRVAKVDPSGVITTIVSPAVTPQGLALDGAGNLYIADFGANRVLRVDPVGTVSTVAGTGVAGFAGDGGPAVGAELSQPTHVAVDGAGNLYIADSSNNRIRRVDLAGAITTIAGNGTPGFSGDNGPAIAAEISNPLAMAIDTDGSVYIADDSNNRIRRVAPNGVITTVAGTGVAGGDGDGGPATNATLDQPSSVALDAAHRLYIDDSSNDLIRRIDANGNIETFAGTIEGNDGDGGPALFAQLNYPRDIAFDGRGQMYIADLFNHRVRRVDTAGNIATVAGQVDPGETGPLAKARLSDPRALVSTPDLTLIAGGSSGTVQAITGGLLEVVAGRYPQATASDPLARYRDSTFGPVSGVAFDGTSIYITAADGIDVIKITDVTNPYAWTITPLANVDGIAGYADGLAANARFTSPSGLYLDAGILYVADTGNHLIRQIDLASGMVTTIAGAPLSRGYFGDGGPAASSLLFGPTALTKCPNGDLFIADSGNNRIRRITEDNTITTVLGDGTASASGEGGPATTFPVDAPQELACDAIGNLFVTSRSVVRMVLANAAGVVDGAGAVRTIYGLPPRDTFPTSVTHCLSGLAVVDPATVRVTDSCTGILLELHRTAN